MHAHRHLLSLLSILALALLVAGCGGSDDSDATSDSSRDASDTPAASDTQAADEGEPAATPPASEARSTIDPRSVVKLYVNAVESCATLVTDGSYTGCLDVARLEKEEPGLTEAPGTAKVTPADDPKYSFVVSYTQDDQTFTETHTGKGEVEKTCTPKNEIPCADGSW